MTFFMTYGRQGTPEEVKAEREILALGWAPSSLRPMPSFAHPHSRNPRA
jgi:hypothetical protein